MKGSSAQGRTSSVTHVINGEFCQTRVVAASVTIQRASEHQKVALCKILQTCHDEWCQTFVKMFVSEPESLKFEHLQGRKH